MSPTNDPSLRSWVPVPPESHFPIQNLPYGICRRRSGHDRRAGVAIGEAVLDLTLLEECGLLRDSALHGRGVFETGTLNAFMRLGRTAWDEVRAAVSRLLRADEPTLRDDAALREHALVPTREAEMLLPADVGDYTDFYSSREHATNVGTMLRGPDKALMPNWLHLPVAYHGRASSVVVSGTDFHRPCGQSKPDPLPLKISGGIGPLTVLVNGAPLVGNAGRTFFWQADGPGFVRLTVMDARGATDSVLVRLQ